jgi:hypothetical protein
MASSMTAANTVFAYDGCGVSGCSDCQQCERIFSDAGQKLTDQLAGMSCCGSASAQNSCCAPPSVCDPGCAAPCGDILSDACGESCGEAGCGKGGCGLFGGALGDPWKLDSKDDGIDFGGWWQQGYTSESTGMFNNLPNRFNTHQAWFYAEKVADGSEGLDWGFRTDAMYGIDAGDTQAFGNNPGRYDFQNGWDRGAGYGWALPQLYAEMAVGDLSVKVGHFFTLLGYEVVPATGNFFFSHAMTMYNSEAFTHTGALATYSASDDVTLYAGWTAGWDTGFDRFNGGSNFLGGASVPVGENVTFTYITTAGNMGVRGDGYSHSTVLDVTLTDKLNYVVQSDLVQFGTNNEVGVNQYLFYTVNDRLKLGTRAEWWKSDAGFNHGGQSAPAGGSVSYYEATFGANYQAAANILVRPEWRYDWSPASGSYEQGIAAVDMIITY